MFNETSRQPQTPLPPPMNPTVVKHITDFLNKVCELIEKSKTNSGNKCSREAIQNGVKLRVTYVMKDSEVEEGTSLDLGEEQYQTAKTTITFLIKNDSVIEIDGQEIPLALLYQYAGNPSNFHMKESAMVAQGKVHELIDFIMQGAEEYECQKLLRLTSKFIDIL